MAVFSCQVTFPFFTNIPRDVFTNTWHFESTLTTAQVAAEVGPRLDTFYTACYSEVLSAAPYVQWDDAVLRVYNLSDLPPRVPEEVAMPIAATVASSTEIPTEVAVVMSFHAAPIGGVPNSRLRNRIYLGGLAEGKILPGSVSAFPKVGSSFMTDICDAAEVLLGENDGNAWWVTYSPTRGLPAEVVGGWVDDSFDTQRRRGIDTSTRQLFSI